ncbi:MAG TPA: tail fiber protein [Acidobacteriaceae bacterium]|nr:tail fiber protein [Acidobacteriaceae bacterium]
MDEFLSVVKLFAIPYAPKGWAPCDGQLLQIMQNQALFALLGTTFGGDGRTTFALPNLQSAPEGLHYLICTEGIFPSRP